MTHSSDFASTQWTLVRNATGTSERGRDALSDLCAAYYAPVVAFLRRGGRNDDAAREAAHAFFADLLARPSLGGAEPGRGRFRNYLLGALKHHLAHQRERDGRKKRGGGIEILPLAPATDTSAGLDPCDARGLPPDREFDRQWAIHVLRTAMERLSAEWTSNGNADEFAALQPFIAGESAHGDLAALAAARGGNAASLRKTLSRLRQRFRFHVREQVRRTVDREADTAEELRELLAAIG